MFNGLFHHFDSGISPSSVIYTLAIEGMNGKVLLGLEVTDSRTLTGDGGGVKRLLEGLEVAWRPFLPVRIERLEKVTGPEDVVLDTTRGFAVHIWNFVRLWYSRSMLEESVLPRLIQEV